MSKIICAFNMTLDGFCDHTAGIADEELHNHYTAVLSKADAMLYGRTTYQLMADYWPSVLQNPTGNAAMDDFAVAIDKVPKIVFSTTLTSLDWHSARLAHKSLEEEVMELKQQPNASIFTGSPSMIVALTNLNLIDEYQLCIHPVILGNGLRLFRDITQQHKLSLQSTRTFGSGVLLANYLKTKA